MLRVLPTTFEPVLQQLRFRDVFFVDGKTGNIAIQLVLQQSVAKQVARFLLPV